MKQDLMSILACPVCKTHPLYLKIIVQKGDDIVTGSLHCPKCQVTYPIEDSIPNLLPQKK
jgi:uncharacterized protein YbaR (Trm112 family)